MHILLNIDYISVWRALFCMAKLRRVWNEAIVLRNISMVTSEFTSESKCLFSELKCSFLKLLDGFFSSTHWYPWVENDKLYSYLFLLERNHNVNKPITNFTINQVTMNPILRKLLMFIMWNTTIIYPVLASIWKFPN